MKPSQALHNHREEVRRIIQRHRARNPRVFGSVLRGVDTDSSDLDLLIETTDATTLMDIAAMEVELTELLGIDVDVLTPNALPKEVREQVLGEARPV